MDYNPVSIILEMGAQIAESLFRACLFLLISGRKWSSFSGVDGKDFNLHFRRLVKGEMNSREEVTGTEIM